MNNEKYSQNDVQQLLQTDGYYNVSQSEIIKDYADCKQEENGNQNTMHSMIAAEELICRQPFTTATATDEDDDILVISRKTDNKFEFMALLQTRNDSLEIEVSNLKTKIKELQNERSSINEDNKKLQREYSMQKLEYERLQQNYDFEKLLFNQTQKKIQKIDKELNEVRLKAVEWGDEYQSAQRKYQELRRKYQTQNQSLKRYKQQNNILQQQFIETQQQTHVKCNQLIQSHSERALSFKKKFNDLLCQYALLETEKNAFKNKYCKLCNEMKVDLHRGCIKKIEGLQSDLAHAQRSILEMSNVVGVKQLLPTVQETLSQFHSMRDQQHHNTSTELKKYIKAQHIKSNKWQKYYINQVVHEILFNSVIKCYDSVIYCRRNMFDVIAQELNMRCTLKHAFYNDTIQEMSDDAKNDDEEKYINDEIDRILSNRFGSYFKDNYKTILKTKMVSEKVMHDILAQEYSECLRNIGAGDTLESLNEFIVQCCDICWVMILQDPPLQLQPRIWQSQKITQFEEKIHKRVLGSDRKCKTILYHVWPVIARCNRILDDQKMDVLLRDKMYTSYK